MFGENGWWSLKCSKLSSLDELDSIALNFRTSHKYQVSFGAEISPVEGSRKKNPNVAEAAGALKEKKVCAASNSRYPKPKQKQLESKEKATKLSNLSFPHELNFTVSQPVVSNSGYLQDNYPTDNLNIWMKEPEESLNLSNQAIINALDEPSYLKDFTYLPSMSDTTFDDMNGKKEYKSEEEDSNFCKTVFTVNKFRSGTVRKQKVVTKDESSIKEQIVPEKNLRLMTPDEEKELLEKLQNYTTAMKEKPVLRRLYRKLMVRKLKRERNLPVFDIDAKVCQLKGIIDPPDCMDHEKPIQEVQAVPVLKFETVLDRFQIGNFNAHEESQQHISFRTRLMGLDEEKTSFISPYTGRILKPFIFRDNEKKPLKMQLLEEILHYTNKNCPNWIPPGQSPIDFCYVRPQHITAINALCHKFFWPGIKIFSILILAV